MTVSPTILTLCAAVFMLVSIFGNAGPEAARSANQTALMFLMVAAIVAEIRKGRQP